MRKVFLATVSTLALILAACTTTKDLERHPDLVAIDAPKAHEKGIEAQQKPGGGLQQGEAKAPLDTAGGAEVPKPPRPEPSETAEAGSTGPAVPPVVVEKKVFIEKPIYYPENTAPDQTKPVDAVANAASKGVTKPKDHNGAMMLYDYDETLVYQVYAMPLRVTDIYLEPGEKLIEQPFCGDTTRWAIGGGVSKTAGVDSQHLYLKPSEEGLETTLIINTDRRIYHLIIKSFKDTFMLAVMWRYPGGTGMGIPQDFLSENNEAGKGSGDKQKAEQASRQATFVVDPALISSDYTVSYPKGNPPQWLPTLVLDDGEKTYIVLPDTVIHHELPAVFGENGEIVNFRVKDNLVVIDRLVKKIQLKLRDVGVEIKKKGA
jgi:type IV secretion system protein VirB9